MKFTHRRRVTLSAAVLASAALLSACGGGAASPAAPAARSGPVTIDVWGWNAETGKQIADAFNAAQSDVKVNYVLQASNTATQTNFRNAMEAKSDVPCLVQGFAPLTTMVVNGWAQDITDAVTPTEDIYNDGAKAAAKVNDRYYGLPSGSDGQFMIVNKDTYDKYGVKIPTTWQEFVDAGKIFKANGVDVTNLAGEDPSTLMNLAQQGGAEWFAIDGDKWKVNFTDKATMAAADIVQQLIDNDFVSNQTYKDRPALYSYFDSGKMASTTTQWWSLTGYKTNFPATSGHWEAVEIPQFSSDKKATPGRSTPSFVPVGCDSPEAVVKYADWLATPEGIQAGKNPKTGSVGLPSSLKDPSPYVKDVIPKGFFVDDTKAAEVMVEAQKATVGKFELGPNYDAWFPELQDQWGKAVAGQIKLSEALKNVQNFVTSDLEKKGISFTTGS
ncbi:ABC transporter substrate-binding protein [Paenarthrobacter sp. RAF54_2]|uniref:ABC transporter substrate-binding protein n=1 Tax=Paenarthrobacter sp. RAF54_2 TaxID=3233061 RepID=UPI003F9E73D1